MVIRPRRVPEVIADVFSESAVDELAAGPRVCRGMHQPTDTPTLYVCHGDDGGPRVHPCRRVQEALRAKGIAYEKVIAAHGSPIPFLRKGSRDELRAGDGGRRSCRRSSSRTGRSSHAGEARSSPGSSEQP